jgi:hypothetical protein
MKKKSFLLLEVLIALTLVTISALPLVKEPLHLFKAEFKAFEELEQERLANLAFVEVKEAFYNHKIPWEKIPEKKDTSSPIPLSPVTIQIPGRPPKTVPCSFTITCTGKKEGLKDQIYKNLLINVKIQERNYSFKIPVQKSPLSAVP